MSLASRFPSIKPSLLLDFANTKRLDPRVTYSRASNARYYDDSTVAKAEENLLTYSQDFSNAAWTKINLTVSVNAAGAPDGTTTADLLYPSSSGAYRYMPFSAMVTPLSAARNQTSTLSVYVKAAGLAWLNFVDGNAGAVRASFDVSTGAVGTPVAGYAATISAEADGYFRCSVTKEGGWGASATPGFVVADGDNSASVTASGTDGVYIWGAQLEQRDSLTAYTATTTQPITNYIPVLLTAGNDVCRFHHDPVTRESLGIYREGLATNLLTWSEDFSNAAWSKNEVSVVPNVAISPDGTLTASKLVISTAVTTHVIARTSIVSSQAVTISIYAKAAGETNFSILDAPTGSNGASFDLSAGTVTNRGTGTGEIYDCGNGWYRCVASTVSEGLNLYCPSSSSVAVGDGYAGIYIWGAQLETGSIATSYIKTEASTADRAADVPTMTGTNFSDWYNQGEGTFVIETGEVPDGGVSRGILTAHDGTLQNSVNMYRSVTSSVMDFYSGAQQAALSTTFSNKSAIAYKTNDSAAAAGGFLLTDSVCNSPAGVNQLIIGSTYAGNTYPLNGTIKSIAYYPKRLTDAQLQTLTA